MRPIARRPEPRRRGAGAPVAAPQRRRAGRGADGLRPNHCRGRGTCSTPERSDPRNEMTDSATTLSRSPADPDAEIVARGGAYYRNTRYAFSVLLLAMAVWFGYDGFVKYPRDNAQHLLHAR